jgi:hypothetical protein
MSTANANTTELEIQSPIFNTAGEFRVANCEVQVPSCELRVSSVTHSDTDGVMPRPGERPNFIFGSGETVSSC